MTEAETFQRILATLYEVALEPARWSTASMLIDEALGVHGSTLVFGDGDTEEDIRIYFAQTWFRGERHPELERLYFETYYAVDERVPRIRHAPDSKLFHIPDLYTAEELRTSAAYNSLRTDGYSGNGINVRLDGPGGSRIFWAVNDPVHGAGWSTAQLDSIRRLLPHIRQTVRVQQTLAGARALGATLTELLDTTAVGIIELDARGRILAVNDRARDVLRTGNGLFDENGLLSARTAEEDANLQALLARALPPFGAQGAGGSMIVRRPDAAPPLALHVHPVGRREMDSRMWPVAALVLVVDPARGPDIDAGVVAATLDLTRMEARVAALLARGMGVAGIAAATGRKESTIRSHVKHMFTKHGLKRQADLVRLVLSLAGAGDARR